MARGFFWALVFFAVLPPYTQAYTSNDYYLAGLNFYVRKDYARSIPYLKTAVKMDPQNWQAWEVLGYDYYLSHQPAQALEAFDQSLRLHPDSPPVRNLAEAIRARIIWDAEAHDIYPRAFRNYEIWVKLDAGVARASLGDLSSAASAFNTTYASFQHNAACDGVGLLGGLEVGFMLDKLNAWGVVVEAGSFNGFKASASDTSGNSLSQTLQPNMVSVQAEYYRYFPVGPFRLWANAGAGVYNTVVNLNYLQNGSPLETGQLSGLGWGGFLGAGFELAVSEQLSLSLSLRGRYATTGNIQGSFTDSSGASQEAGLAFGTNGLLAAYPTYQINVNGWRYAKIDYTGGDMVLAVSYHY